tara:strand:+ start:2383 stop:2715 length:333 start_codon:yes stop_codon:yes gene_type:complete
MLVLGALKKQGCLIRGMGKAGTIGGTLSLIVGVLFLIGWFGAGMGIDYIDNQLEENCDSTSGQIGQITGWDEGQCQDGRDSRDLLSSLQYSLLLGGAALCSTGVFMLIRF